MPLRRVKKFKDLKPEEFFKKLDKLFPDKLESYNPNFVFISPNSNKDLKEKYKQKKVGRSYTEYFNSISAKPELVHKAADKLQRNAIYSDLKSDSNMGSLKMHVSINNIGEINHKILLEFLTFLENESLNPKNNLLFKYKIIRPSMASDQRFSMNDQITIYFDKYSSLGALMQLKDKINQFMKERKIPENTARLGKKDAITLNSFTSLRFDTNKLHRDYGQYRFFDLEIKKFIERHTPSEFENFSLFSFEKIFNDILLSRSIHNLNAGDDEEQGLSDEDSKKVQERLDSILKNPTIALEKNKSYEVISVLETYLGNLDDQSDSANITKSIITLLLAELEEVIASADLSEDAKLHQVETILKNSLNKALVTNGGSESVNMINDALSKLHTPQPDRPVQRL